MVLTSGNSCSVVSSWTVATSGAVFEMGRNVSAMVSQNLHFFFPSRPFFLFFGGGGFVFGFG